MKSTILNKLLLLSLALCLCTALVAESVPFYAKITNPTDRYLMFSYKKKGMTDASVFRIDLKENNEARFELQLEEAKFIDLIYAGKTLPIYLELGDELGLSFDATNINGTLRYEGKGAANNNFLAEYRRKYATEQYEYDIALLKVQVDEPMATAATTQTASQYVQIVNRQQAEQVSFLASKKSSLSAALANYMDTEITYSNAVNKIAWFLENSFSFTESSLATAKQQIPIEKGVNFQKDDLLQHPAYNNFLRAYAFYKLLPYDLNRTKLYIPLYKKINETMSGKVKYHLLTDLLLKVYDRTLNTDLAFKNFEQFALNNPYPEYTQTVIDYYGGQLSGVKNTEAPDIQLTTPDGKTVYLSNYKGKVVYLSFWASWCKPCIASFKKSAVTRQKLADMGVVLLNVSIDESDAAWRKAMAQHNPLGEHGLVLSLEDISKNYNVSSIPQYYIVDKNGKFAYLSDNGQRNILEEFRQLVER